MTSSVEYLADKRMNIDLLLAYDARGILLIGVRLRPWKQEGRRPRMVLSQGLTLQDAIDKAARDYHLDRWEELDWTLRPWNNHPTQYLGSEEPEQLDFLEPSELSNTDALTASQNGATDNIRPLTRKMGKTST